MFKYPLGHAGFASMGLIFGHDLLNPWSRHLVQMDIHLTEFAVFWGKFLPIFQPHKIGGKILDPWEMSSLENPGW
jgi:hypothetical protein